MLLAMPFVFPFTFFFDEAGKSHGRAAKLSDVVEAFRIQINFNALFEYIVRRRTRKDRGLLWVGTGLSPTRFQSSEAFSPSIMN